MVLLQREHVYSLLRTLLSLDVKFLAEKVFPQNLQIAKMLLILTVVFSLFVMSGDFYHSVCILLHCVSPLSSPIC